MNKIFIFGSRSIKELNKDIINRLNNIIEKEFEILIGDCYGVDLIVQKYLFYKKYTNVTIYCSNKCRNNVGNWNIKKIIANNVTGRELYELKDLEMIEDCTYAFGIWDYKSKGSLNNIKNLKKINKRVLIYFYNKKSFLLK